MLDIDISKQTLNLRLQDFREPVVSIFRLTNENLTAFNICVKKFFYFYLPQYQN